MLTFLRRAILFGLPLMGVAITPAAVPAADITVFAASSLKNALDRVAADWQAETGDTVVVSYGGSPVLAKQIQEGAPADIFISASERWMDVLADAALIQPATRKDVLGNRLVLIAAGTDAAPVVIAPGFDLAARLGQGKLSMALVDSVPAGQYGKQALENLGIWPSVAASVAQSENVRAALALVATGEAPLGIVYASDAIADDGAGNKVTVIGTFPADSHAPIVYPAALIAGSANARAAAFLANLSSDEAHVIFEQQGFIVLK